MSSKKLFTAFSASNYQLWKEEAIKSLKGKNFEQTLVSTNKEGLTIHPYYDDNSNNALTTPPKNYFPAITGITGINNEWEIRENIYIDKLPKANKNALNALNSGANSLAFFVNKDTDFNILLKEIKSEYISIYFITPHPIEILEKWQDYNKQKNTNAIARGAIEWNSTENIDTIEIAKNLYKTLGQDMPYYRFINFSTSSNSLHKDAVEQLSELLYDGNKHLQNMLNHNLSIDEVTNRIQFTINVGKAYFMEIAKIRALRLLWANVIRQYQPKHACSEITFIHTIITSYTHKEEEKSDLFIGKTSKVMSAIIGGADSISFSEDADEFTSRINRNIQLLAAEEAHLAKVNDPAAGSYFIDNLTQELAKKAWDNFVNKTKT